MQIESKFDFNTIPENVPFNTRLMISLTSDENVDHKDQPLNIGTGQDITIKELVEYISDAVKYNGEVVWNTDKPDGQMKKLLSVDKMKTIIQIDPMSVKEGIQKTVDWYIENKEEADARK